jgi:hypothetical protein
MVRSLIEVVVVARRDGNGRSYKLAFLEIRKGAWRRGRERGVAMTDDLIYIDFV